MADIFHEEPIYRSLRFASVFLEQGALTASDGTSGSIGPSNVIVSQPQLSATCAEDLLTLGDFDDERQLKRKIAAAAVKESAFAKKPSSVVTPGTVGHIAVPPQGGGPFTEVIMPSTSATATASSDTKARGWTCPACTLVNPESEVKW